MYSTHTHMFRGDSIYSEFNKLKVVLQYIVELCLIHCIYLRLLGDNSVLYTVHCKVYTVNCTKKMNIAHKHRSNIYLDILEQQCVSSRSALLKSI